MTRVDAELRAIAKQRQQLLAREAVLVVRAEELELWRAFGCVTLFEYLERFCDLHPRTAREYVRVARALARMPVMRGELDSHRIVYSTARELTRIATPETEREWLAAVAGMNPREIEEEVAGREPGDRPNDPKDPERLVTLTLKVRTSTFAQYVEARTRDADARGERVSDDELALSLFRPDPDALDHGAPAYQVAITTCRACAKAHQVAGGREVEVSAATNARARCDARDLGDLEADAVPRSTASVTPRTRRRVIARDAFMCRVPDCRSQRHLDVHHIVFQSKRGANKASNLITLCGGHHQRLHEGALTVSGTAPHAVMFAWRDDPDRTSTRRDTATRGPVGRREVTFEEAAAAAQAAFEAMPDRSDPQPTGPRDHEHRGAHATFGSAVRPPARNLVTLFVSHAH